MLVPFIYCSILYFRVGSSWIINSHPVSFCLTLALRFEFTSGWDPTKVPFQFFFLCALSTKMDKIHVYVFRRPFNKVCSCFPFQTYVASAVARPPPTGPSFTPASARGPSSTSTRSASSSGSGTPRRSSASCATTGSPSRRVSSSLKSFHQVMLTLLLSIYSGILAQN